MRLLDTVSRQRSCIPATSSGRVGALESGRALQSPGLRAARPRRRTCTTQSRDGNPCTTAPRRLMSPQEFFNAITHRSVATRGRAFTSLSPSALTLRGLCPKQLRGGSGRSQAAVRAVGGVAANRSRSAMRPIPGTTSPIVRTAALPKQLDSWSTVRVTPRFRRSLNSYTWLHRTRAAQGVRGAL